MIVLESGNTVWLILPDASDMFVLSASQNYWESRVGTWYAKGRVEWKKSVREFYNAALDPENKDWQVIAPKLRLIEILYSEQEKK